MAVITPDNIIYSDGKTEVFKTDEEASNLLSKVYAYMFMGLGVTAVVGFLFAFSRLNILVSSFPGSFFIFFIVQLLLVATIPLITRYLNYKAGMIVFLIYSGLSGLTIAGLLQIYDLFSFVTTFIVASLMFAAMAFYGYITKQDLTSYGNIAFMGLIGVIAGSLFNIFFSNGMLDWILTYIGIGVFLVLIAYDTQKLKMLSTGAAYSNKEDNALAVIGALSLYLDFINLFTLLLRIFGRRS